MDLAVQIMEQKKLKVRKEYKTLFNSCTLLRIKFIRISVRIAEIEKLVCEQCKTLLASSRLRVLWIQNIMLLLNCPVIFRRMSS